MTAKDFAASYRHVIQRLRAKGVTNAVNVVAYMGNEKWMAQSWWKDLYPGDDVVDWIGLDSYVSAPSRATTTTACSPTCSTASAPGGERLLRLGDHPTTRASRCMVAEWGVYHRVGQVVGQVGAVQQRPAGAGQAPGDQGDRATSTPSSDAFGDRDISINSSARSLASFRKLAANPIFNVQLH